MTDESTVKSTATLITADELADLLDQGRPPTLLDVRWRLGGPPGRELYQAGHIPGAVFVDLDHDLARPPGSGGRHPMPLTADFQAAMRRAGVSDDRPVVVYDDADSTAAARGWWLLGYFGHPSVRVLDGGFRAWTTAGHPVESGSAESAGPAGSAEQVPGDFTARPGQLPLLDADGATELARTGLLLDARAAQRYRGETEPVDKVAGHIPGAVNAPTTENVNPDGTFLSARDLAARFAALGATAVPASPDADADAAAATSPDADADADAAAATSPGAAPSGTDTGTGTGTGTKTRTVGVYCGSGVTAAHEALALSLAGIPAALYIGSWSNWITDPSRPIATGGESTPPAIPA